MHALALIFALAMTRPRLRDLGVIIGTIPTGPLNAITDVEGVRVGHATLIRGESVRTGVTAVLPHGGNLFQQKVPGAVFVGNGFGKIMGTTQVEELGEIETPILLTSTLNVPRVGDVVVVNSFHHQGIADPGRLTPTGWCPDDGLIETVEDPSKRFVIGVQWHPEDTTDFRLFAALVEAARVVRSTTSIAAPPTSRGATGRQP